MPELFEETTLWRSSLGADDVHVKRLAGALLTARKNVQDLLSGIPGDMKGYTVHDVSHLDALWEIADLIAGPDFQLNPAEAFVFGVSVLLHDSGMSVLAYPGGIDEVVKTDVWGECAASFGVAGQDINSIPSGLKSSLVTNVLRILHAQQAEKLATQTWSMGSRHFHLIEDDDLRNHYGPIAGRIAHSHHWDSQSLSLKFSSTLGSFGGMPSSWTIDGVKVATLLRCADAAHIDHRRAPRRLFAMTKPQGLSEVHWNFQSRLAKPYVSNRRLQYSSIDPFDVSLVDAWYLCFDTAQMIDKELADADENLRGRGAGFVVTGVQGAKSVEKFSQNVATAGWKPVGVDVQVSDVPALAKTLGGEALYSSKIAPIRELIQNAADSIDARVQIDSDFSKSKGRIVVRIRELDARWVLDVEDNGIGMSERVLTRALLDFGKSFWRSEMMREEYPSMQRGFQESRGKFGIGFFSIFMWSEKVTVVSRKFSEAQSATMAIEFLGGISKRPILREAHARERSSETITRVSVEISEEIANLLLGKVTRPQRRQTVLGRLEGGAYSFGMEDFLIDGRSGNPVQNITAALDIDVYLESGGNLSLVNNRAWKSLSSRDFIEYFSKVCGDFDADAGAELLSEVVECGRSVGRALMVPGYLEDKNSMLLVHDKGITVGFQGRLGMFGVIEGAISNAARDRVAVVAPNKNEGWMNEQVARIFLSAQDPARQIAAQKTLLRFGRFASDKILFILDREMVSLEQALDKIATSGHVDIRLSEASGRFEWREASDLGFIIGLNVDPHLLSVLCGMSLRNYDMSNIHTLFAGEANSFGIGKVFSEIGRVLGVDHKVDVRMVDSDAYSRRKDMLISVSRAKNVE